MRAFTELWEITTERYKVKNPKYRRFRYGVQVNSLGPTEEQPENTAWRILIESLGVTLSSLRAAEPCNCLLGMRLILAKAVGPAVVTSITAN